MYIAAQIQLLSDCVNSFSQDFDPLACVAKPLLASSMHTPSVQLEVGVIHIQCDCSKRRQQFKLFSPLSGSLPATKLSHAITISNLLQTEKQTLHSLRLNQHIPVVLTPAGKPALLAARAVTLTMFITTLYQLQGTSKFTITQYIPHCLSEI